MRELDRHLADLDPLGGELPPSLPFPDLPRGAVSDIRYTGEAARADRRRWAATAVGGLAAIVAAVVLTGLVGGADTAERTAPPASPAGASEAGAGVAELTPPTGGSAPAARARITFIGTDADTISVNARGLPADEDGEPYALWLVESDGGALRLGFTPRVDDAGDLRFVSPMPEDVDVTRYAEVVLSREPGFGTTEPTDVLLAGRLPADRASRIPPADVRITIVDTSADGGLGTDAASRLESAGYDVISVIRSGPARAGVYFLPRYQSAAESVAELFDLSPAQISPYGKSAPQTGPDADVVVRLGG